MTQSARARDDVIDVAQPTPAWRRSVPRAAAVAAKAAAAAIVFGLQGLPPRHPLRRHSNLEVGIALGGDVAVRRLNRLYRGQDKATNVLAFPAGDAEWPLLGDVIVAHGVAVREARAEGKTTAAHLTHLVMHGVLHLLGYDHGSDRDAKVMERLESEIMARLGLPDPYVPIPRAPRRRGAASRSTPHST